jgi:hypothetical protein
MIMDTKVLQDQLDDNQIKRKLDDLAEYQAQRELLEINKRALLDDVKIPAEVEAIMSEGMKRINEIENNFQPEIKLQRAKMQAELALVVIPDEIKAQLADIDRKRNLILEEDARVMETIRENINNTRLEINEEIQSQTKQVYVDISQRKADIEAEFSGKSQAVDENIKKLTEDIKADLKITKHTVNGKFFQAIYVKGRTSWNNDMLDGMICLVPQLEQARKIGEPSVTIRKI